MLDYNLILNKNSKIPINRFELINLYKGNCINYIMGNCDNNCNLFHNQKLRDIYLEELFKSIENKELPLDQQKIKEEFKGFCYEYISTVCTNKNCKFYHYDKLKNEYDQKKNPCYCSYYLQYGNCRVNWCRYIHDDNAYANYSKNLENANNELELYKKINNKDPEYCVFWVNNCCSNTKCNFDHKKKIFNRNFNIIKGVKTPITSSNINNDNFIGITWSSNSMLCKNFNCDCSKHNMLEQTQSNVGNFFDNYIKSNKIPLKELMLKLNKIYYDNFIIIQSEILNSKKSEYLSLPNNNLTLKELQLLFTSIHNKEIYAKNLTQTEFALIYELFRRVVICPKYKCFSEGIIYDNDNKPNYCFYGRNCIKGHHGFNGICREDFYNNKCNCKNFNDEIKKLEEEIKKQNVKENNDDFINVNENENRKNKIKQLKRKIEYFELNNMLHLNRENHCTDNINLTNTTKNYSIMCHEKILSEKDDNINNDLWNEYINSFVIENNKEIKICFYFTIKQYENILKKMLENYDRSINWSEYILN